VADLLTASVLIAQKEVLSASEAATYMNVSLSHLYKLTAERKVPHFKPMGKMVYFNRLELESWLQSNRVATDAELEQQAQKLNRKEAKK
jgi:excisionase family DNA binding protein